MTHTIRLLSLLAILTILASCNLRHAAQPWAYAAPYTCCSWEGEEKEVPRCLLTQDPPCCEEEACEEIPETLDLCEVLDIALKKNPKTRSSWAKARIAAAWWGMSQRNFYPQIDFNAFWVTLRESDFFGMDKAMVNKFREFSPWVSLNYLILDFGTTVYRSQVFCQQLMSANWAHNREIQTVIQTVSSDYYDYITQGEKVHAAKANLEDATTVLKATEAKRKAGVVSITDELIAKTQVSQEKVRLLSDEQAEADIKAKLLADMGVPANECVQFETIVDICESDSLRCSLDNYLCLAYLSRPDLQGRYSELLSADSFVKAARSDQLPKLSFQGTYGKKFFDDWVCTNGEDYTAQINLTFPLFAGYYYENKIRQAEADRELAKSKLTEMELGMVQQVVTSYQDLQYAREQLEVNRTYVDLANQTFAATLANYKNGTVDITTLMKSLTNLSNARFSLANAKKLWFDAVTNLTYATGTLNADCRNTL